MCNGWRLKIKPVQMLMTIVQFKRRRNADYSVGVDKGVKPLQSQNGEC